MRDTKASGFARLRGLPPPALQQQQQRGSPTTRSSADSVTTFSNPLRT